MDEQFLLGSEKIYRWPGPKRKATLVSGTLGRILLTSQRLLFLSTGKHDVTAGKLMAGAVFAPIGLRTDSTEGLDLSALSNEGSLEVPIEKITSCELKGMFKYLVVHYVDDAGQAAATAFAPKNGGMPAGPTWVETIEQSKGTPPP